jgi:hypothetical protein
MNTSTWPLAARAALDCRAVAHRIRVADHRGAMVVGDLRGGVG